MPETLHSPRGQFVLRHIVGRERRDQLDVV